MERFCDVQKPYETCVKCISINADLYVSNHYKTCRFLIILEPFPGKVKVVTIIFGYSFAPKVYYFRKNTKSNALGKYEFTQFKMQQIRLLPKPVHCHPTNTCFWYLFLVTRLSQIQSQQKDRIIAFLW